MVIGGFAANISAMLMDDELDRRVPGRARDSFMHWRGVQSFSEYRNSCPDGKLHIFALAGLAVAAVGMIALVILGLTSTASPTVE